MKRLLFLCLFQAIVLLVAQAQTGIHSIPSISTIAPRDNKHTRAQETSSVVTITVKVVIDENGNVISAKAKNGPNKLRKAAEKAALESKFSPTIIEGTPVKIQGTLVYKFSPKS